MDNSDPVTQGKSVAAPPLPIPGTSELQPNPKHRWWAIPMAALGLGIGLSGVVASAVFVDAYADAPGTADDVNARMAFTAVERYDPEGEILFVTVAGPHATALQGIIGWIDPDVQFDTYAERYGDSTPDEERTISLARMRDAKNDAPYVALTKLGYPTEVVPGQVLIDFVFCQVPSEDGMSCITYFPAVDFFQPGDVIVRVNGKAIITVSDITPAIEANKPGDIVEVVVLRPAAAPSDAADPSTPADPETSVAGGTEVTGSVMLSADPDDPNRKIFGVRLVDTSEIKIPFPIDIDTGKIGGPSAGLAFALTVMDEVTPGELTGGKRVAVTGTIDVDGVVGPIGGIHQKAAAVKRDGVDAFIVPSSQSPEELADIRSILGEDRVFAVATIDEALDALASLGGNGGELGTPGTSFVLTD